MRPCSHQARRSHRLPARWGFAHCYGSNKFKVEQHQLPHTGSCCPPTGLMASGTMHAHSDEAEPCGCDGSLNASTSVTSSTKVRHGDHYDWLVGDSMHHKQGTKCLNHGTLKVVSPGDLERHMFVTKCGGSGGSTAAGTASLPFNIVLM
jgi:hypothetical protein